MLSRKQFFKALLSRGFRAVSDLSASDESLFAENEEVSSGFDLPATELSPSLLAIEAERRGLDLGGDCAEELRREIYRELAQNRPHSNPPSPPLSKGVGGFCDDFPGTRSRRFR